MTISFLKRTLLHGFSTHIDVAFEAEGNCEHCRKWKLC